MADERRARVVLPIAAGAGVVAGAVGTIAGLDLVSAALLAVAVLLVGTLALLAPGDGDPGWPEEEQEVSSDGARREVARLSWAMHGKDSRVEARSARRLHAVAAARLAERGLDLDDPADASRIVAVLGAGPYEALCCDLRHPPHFDRFTEALAVVDGLHPASGSAIRDLSVNDAAPDERASLGDRTLADERALTNPERTPT